MCGEASLFLGRPRLHKSVRNQWLPCLSSEPPNGAEEGCRGGGPSCEQLASRPTVPQTCPSGRFSEREIFAIISRAVRYFLRLEQVA